MKNDTAVRDLAIHELQLLLRVEPLLSQGFAKLLKRQTDADLRRFCREGVEYTDRRVVRIHEALKALGTKPAPRASHGLPGLIRDALAACAGRPGAARDARMLGAIERISHYGLAAQATIDRYLREAREPAARRILSPSLREKREAIAEMDQMMRRDLIPRLRAKPR